MDSRAPRRRITKQADEITAEKRIASKNKVEMANAGSVNAGVVTKKPVWFIQSRLWAKGTIMQVMFKIKGKNQFMDGKVIKNTDWSLINRKDTSFQVLFSDGETLEFEHEGFFKKNKANAMHQTNLSTMLTNDFLYVLRSSCPAIPLIDKAWGTEVAGAGFRSNLQIDIDSLMNSEPDLQDRTDRIRELVEQFKSFRKVLVVQRKVDKAVLRWVSNVANFDCQIADSSLSSQTSTSAGSPSHPHPHPPSPQCEVPAAKDVRLSPSELPLELQLSPDELKTLCSHVPMVCAAPVSFASLPLVEGDEPAVLNLDNLDRLVETGTFDPSRACIMGFGPEIDALVCALGRNIDEALHGRAVFCNSSSKTRVKNKHCIPSLFEDVTLLSKDDTPETSSSQEIHRQQMDCDKPTIEYAGMISYCRYGRGTADTEYMDDLKPGVYEEFVQVSSKIQHAVLAAIESWCERNGAPFKFGSGLERRSLAMLLTYPRKPGPPSTWQCDFTGGCRIAEAVSTRIVKRKSVANAEAPIETRSRQSPFSSLLCFPCLTR